MPNAMNCDDVAGLLDALIDGELRQPDRAAVAHHVEACATCSAAVAGRRALSLRVASLDRHPPPPHLAASMATAIDNEIASREPQRRTARTERPRLQRWLPATHVMAACLGGLAIAVLMQAGISGDAVRRLDADAVGAHVRGLVQEQFPQMQSGDGHQVRPWFTGKIGFAPPVADLTTSGFPLSGARVDELDGQPAAALLYGRRQHRITLLVAPNHKPGCVAARTTRERGYNVVAWSDASFAFRAVSDLNAEELVSFAALIRQTPPAARSDCG